MVKILEAVYRDGALVPLEPLDLPEDQRVTITIHVPAVGEPEEALEAWHQVYAGLSDEDIAEVDRIARNRIHLMRQED